jgi:hypothetical protein
MNDIISTVISDLEIQNIFTRKEKEYLISQFDPSFHSDIQPEKTLRLAFLLINYTLTEKQPELFRKICILLKTININEVDTQKSFDDIMGIDGINPISLYYFYLSSISLKNDRIINARIDLREYDNDSINKNYDNWRNRVLNNIIESFILLIRKSNGFKDIRQALNNIKKLVNEQKEFEEKYLKKYDYYAEINEAYILLGLYHLSKTIVEVTEYLINGYNYSKRVEVEIRQHADTAKKLLKQEPRLNCLAMYIEDGLNTIVSNSIWAKTKITDTIKSLCKFKAEDGILDLLPSQRNAINKNLLDVAANVTVLQMPTSAGKTLLAEFNILVTKALQPSAKIIYVVPSRALVNQIYYDLKTDLQPLNLSIEKTSSAIEIDPTENSFLSSDSIDILVSTPEKLDLLIRRRHPSVENISLFVIDEAHTIQSGIRGARLELLLALLKRERPNAKFMLLSPFFSKMGNTLAEWLGGGISIKIDWKPSEKILLGVNHHKTKKIDEIQYNILNSAYNQVDIAQKGEFENPYQLQSTGLKDRILEFSVNHFARKNKTMLILCAGKNTTNKRANFIYDRIPDKVVHDDVKLVRKFIIDEVGKETILTNVLTKGICTHHAGLSDETKLLLEHLIRERHISYVCSTTTVAEGVNFPVSSIFFDTYQKGRNSNNKPVYLSANDFWNIAGRSGRTLIDNFGILLLPFNSNPNIENAERLIKNTADEIISVLSELLINADSILREINDKQSIGVLLSKYPNSLTPLIQYFVHLISIGEHTNYINQIEDLFKDSFEYYSLNESTDKDKFINICKSIYLYLQDKYGNSKGVLSFADKTGFSVPSVLAVMRDYSENPNIADLDSWKPENLFNTAQIDNLASKIKVIAALRETDLGTDSREAPFNAEIMAKVIIAWVKGKKLVDISNIHPAFSNIENDDEKINKFVTKMNDVRFKSSWGLSALEGIVKGNVEDIKDSFVPSFVYYGVDNEKSLAMRMIGIPRELSSSLSRIIEKDVNEYSFQELRKRVNSLTDADWDSFKPPHSTLSGQEWKRISEILMK